MQNTFLHTKKCRLLSIVLVIVLVAGLFSLTGCKKHVKDSKNMKLVSNDLATKLDAYRVDLMDSTYARTGNDELGKYLKNWAESKGITFATDEVGNIIMTAEPGNGYANAKPTILICPYDAAQYDQYVDPIVLSLYVLKHRENTGKLTVIFTKEDKHAMTGAASLSKGLFPDSANVICLNASPGALFSLNTGGGKVFRFYEKTERKEPTYATAYVIHLSGLQNGQLTGAADPNKNPILLFRSLLQQLDKRHIGYELASIQADNGGMLIPNEAEMVLCVEDQQVNRFLSILASQEQSFRDGNAETNPDAVFEYSMTDLPKTVISREDCDRFVSFLYTIMTGPYAETEEETILAIAGLTSVKSGKKGIEIKSVGYSLLQNKLTEISASHKTLAHLSDLSFREEGDIPSMLGSSKTEFSTDLASAYSLHTGKKLSYQDSVIPNQASLIRRLNPSCSIVAMSVNNNVLSDCAGTILEYLINNRPQYDF